MNLSNRKFCGDNYIKYNVKAETKGKHINELHVEDS